MRNRLGRYALALCALAALGACKDASGPKSGELVVSVQSTRSDDAAMLIRIAGPGEITGITAESPSTTLFAQPAGASADVAVFGAALSGPLLRFTVPDVGKAAKYTATLLQVADAANALRPDPAAYRAEIARKE